MRRIGPSLLVSLVVCILVGTATAIYSSDHWKYSTKLTKENFESTVQSEIDAGRTLFVRWIASPQWGWWQKQAPGWNSIIQEFSGNSKVSFGDINLREESISGAPHNPGQGGWPTIRYFNQDTGPEGGSYVQKTDGPICEELKKEQNMRAYVQEYGSAFACSVMDDGGCDEKEVAYISKMKEGSAEDRVKQLKRLVTMMKESMKPELKTWVLKRKSILEQLTVDGSKDEL